MNRKYFVLLISFFIVCLCSCQKAVEKRKYEEIVISAQLNEGSFAPSMPPIPLSENLTNKIIKPQLSWTTPPGWQEKPASGMRVASFVNNDSANPIDCSIVSLEGEAGGLQANVRRWLSQINLYLSDEELKTFLEKQDKLTNNQGLVLTLVDFTNFNTVSSGDSIIAAIAAASEETIFVKMTGSKEALLKNREPFITLCKSLQRK